MKTDDTDLIERIRAGETESFGRLVRRYQGGVQGLAYHVVGSFEDAEDIAQETFVSAYLKLDQLRDPEAFHAWLRQLTLNRCRMWMRKRRDHTPLDEAGELPSSDLLSPAEEYERAETRRVVHRELGRLTDDNRLVIALCYLSGWNLREIAHFLDVPLSTVEGRMQRAKRQLRGRLMTMVEDTLREKKLDEEFTRKVLDQALEKAREARKNWAREDFVRFCQEASRAAERLDDGKARVELHTMMGEAGATWLGNPENAFQEYKTALAVARKHQDEGAEARVLKEMVAAHCRHHEYDRMRSRAQEALEVFARRGDGKGEGLAWAALDLAGALPGVWKAGQPGGYAMTVFPVESGPEGVRFLDPEGTRNYTWGCPSRCTSFAHLLRPKRLLGPDLSRGAEWEDLVVYGRDGLSWGIEKEDRLVARSTVESTGDLVVTHAGRFEGCLRVKTCVAPSAGGIASRHATRSFCGTRLTWFAPGIGLVKIRHEDQNGQFWAVYLVEYQGMGGEDYFPMTAGFVRRYRWVEPLTSRNLFEDTVRVVSSRENVSYWSSATWGREQSDEETRTYFSKALDLERASGDLVGEAMCLEKCALSEAAKSPCYERLASIYDTLGDEWKLLGSRWRLKTSGGELSIQDRRQWREEQLALARRMEDRRKTIESLDALAWSCRERGEYDRAIDLLEESSALAALEGDVKKASLSIATADLARALSLRPPGPGVAYIYGNGYLVEKETGRLETTGSCRCIWQDYPPGPEGSPMTDLFQNGPHTGIEILGDPPGTTTADGLNAGVLKGKICESMRTASTLVAKNETVETGAGRFRGCALIETATSTSGEDRQLDPNLERVRGYYAGVKQAWFAPGIGLVRLVYRHRNGYLTEMQLVEYQISEPSDAYLPLALGNRWRYRWTDPESGTAFEESLRVASHIGKDWNIAFVTRAESSQSHPGCRGSADAG